jgi:hypothetical protein
MSISVSFYKDRNGTVYTKNVGVDEEVSFDPAADMSTDMALKAAKAWFEK